MAEIFDRAVHLFPMSEEFWLDYSEVAAEPADILAKVIETVDMFMTVLTAMTVLTVMRVVTVVTVVTVVKVVTVVTSEIFRVQFF